ncbi:hypothetical protein ACM55I_03885 [Flavobacterium sp. GB2R13]|uniref:hypothetical protein n=1 Tax=Flavobacterium algoris TaxID=3398733 RepID=UPI003A867107
MSAIAALKGYRTQFLYSLHFILSNMTSNLIFRLEGEEDLDILDANGQLLYAIQLKNLGRRITLSDIISDKKTSFIKRFLDNYNDAIPILVSYGEISSDLKKWAKQNNKIDGKEKNLLKKYKLTIENWKLVKSKTQFQEVNEEKIAEDVEKMMKDNFPLIDPLPTIGFLLNWLQFIAEKQQPITSNDFFNKVEDFAKYITERIAISEQYGLILKPLHKVSIENLNHELLEKEFYNATLTRYEHILLGLDINRDKLLGIINEEISENNTIVIKGASGQGKTALLYSYVHKYINNWLCFELNIQQDSIITQKSIQAIASISKKLDIPIVFIINVNPNTTDWLQVIKESVHLNHIKFLVAIRNEDWYRASAIGIEFEHKEIDLILSKEEAEIIYSRLHERNKISHFADFEEAWIQLGNNTPLLEFVYSLTQGDSLLNKLKQQIRQILIEGGLSNNQQIEFLRIVSLADSLGAKIDVSKLDSSIDYQFIIEKLSNEYLVKKSSDRKYIQGLHIVRSQKLVEILFDEFTNSKEEYGYKCISLLAEQDLYLFLLHLIHLEIFKPEQFISDINNKISVNNWSIYTSILKAFIWAGTREYVEKNRELMDECKSIFGEAWKMFIDFLFGSNYDRSGLLDLLKIDEERRKKIDDINNRLVHKQHVFNLASNVINKLPFPKEIPVTEIEWKSFGQSLFWLKNIDNKKERLPLFTDSEFESAFKLLDSKNLSKLMLGMYSYSPELDSIRKKYINYFVDRIKTDFDVIHLSVNGDEVDLHYIINILTIDSKRSTNDFVVTILNIIRSALPDKKQFNSQGYGHRLQTISVDHDSTHKTMPIENMPLEEWVGINSSIVKLYEFKDRPNDWNDYCQALNQWEILIKEKINEVNNSFDQLFKGSKTYAPMIPVMQNVLFNKSENLKEPKSITDPLGIYGDDLNSENEREQVKKSLESKYEKFFKSLSDFKTSIESFINQSAQTLTSRIKLTTEEGHINDENIERVSQINLYDAIQRLKEYNSQYKNTLYNIDVNHTSEIDFNTLLTTAAYWKDFLNKSTKADHSYNRILKLKADFDSKIVKEFKLISKSNSYTIKYINNTLNEEKPIVVIDGISPFWSQLGMKAAYDIIHEVINKPEYTSLKYLMLKLWFSRIYFIQTTDSKIIDKNWNEIRLYTIMDNSYENLNIVGFGHQLISNKILENLKIDSWAQMYPEFNEISKASENYGRLVLLVDHIHDLRLLDKIKLEELDQKRLQQHFEKVSLELQQSFQNVLDSLVMWMNMFPFDETTYINNEEEQEYFKAIVNIKDNIFPEPKGDEEDYQVLINLEIISKWGERLKICTESWGIFLILLHGKYINKYKKIT